MKRLLTEGKNNTKTAKNSLKTYYLSLQPASLNSKKENLCKFSTKACRDSCLQYAGRQIFSNVVKSRERKTELFVNNRELFISTLWEELKVLNKSRCAVRLNLLSDVDWKAEFLRFGFDLSELDKIQMYDYTKDHLKILSNDLPNYHLTLSHSGYNWPICE